MSFLDDQLTKVDKSILPFRYVSLYVVCEMDIYNYLDCNHRIPHEEMLDICLLHCIRMCHPWKSLTTCIVSIITHTHTCTNAWSILLINNLIPAIPLTEHEKSILIFCIRGSRRCRIQWCHQPTLTCMSTHLDPSYFPCCLTIAVEWEQLVAMHSLSMPL